MRASSLVSTLIALLALGATLSAHRLDEYLQSARIGIEPDRVDVELSLTPGVAVVDRIVADIDRDRDGAVSSAEQDAYASLVLSAIHMTIDGTPLQAQVIATTVSSLETLRLGDGSIRIHARAALPPVSTGVHHLEFNNGHLRDASVYLANALVPESDRVAVRAQRRDEAQQQLVIEYVLHAEAPLDFARDRQSSAFTWLMGAAAIAIGLFTGLRYRNRPAVTVIP